MPSSARRYRPLLLRAGLAIVGRCLQHDLEPAQDQQVEGVEPIKEPFGEAALGAVPACVAGEEQQRQECPYGLQPETIAS